MIFSPFPQWPKGLIARTPKPLVGQLFGTGWPDLARPFPQWPKGTDCPNTQATGWATLWRWLARPSTCTHPADTMQSRRKPTNPRPETQKTKHKATTNSPPAGANTDDRGDGLHEATTNLDMHAEILLPEKDQESGSAITPLPPLQRPAWLEL